MSIRTTAFIIIALSLGIKLGLWLTNHHDYPQFTDNKGLFFDQLELISQALAQQTTGVPSGAVMSFNLTTCPGGWSEVISAQGRYLVGLTDQGKTSGGLGVVVGTALSDRENRAVGKHNHTTTDPGHSHLISESETTSPFGNNALRGSTSTIFSLPSQSTTTGISINDAGTISGTNAPYIQLLVCKKD